MLQLLTSTDISSSLHIISLLLPMKMLRQVWRELLHGENIDLYITFVTAIILASFNLVRSLDPKILISVNMAVLALVAVSLLTTRRIVENSARVRKASVESIFFEEYPENYRIDFENAKEIWLVGVTLTSTIRNNYSLIESKLRKKHFIRVLLVNPEGEALKMADMRDFARPNIERTKNEVFSSLQFLADLKQIAPDRLQIKTIHHPLGFGATAINPEDISRGTIYIQHYAFKTPGGSVPKFVVQVQDGKWYQHFKAEMENLWHSGNEWTVENE